MSAYVIANVYTAGLRRKKVRASSASVNRLETTDALNDRASRIRVNISEGDCFDTDKRIGNGAPEISAALLYLYGTP